MTRLESLEEVLARLSLKRRRMVDARAAALIAVEKARQRRRKPGEKTSGLG